METLTIGRSAERGGVNLETVRYYEREGLMLPPPRMRAPSRALVECHPKAKPQTIDAAGGLQEGMLRNIIESVVSPTRPTVSVSFAGCPDSRYLWTQYRRGPLRVNLRLSRVDRDQWRMI